MFHSSPIRSQTALEEIEDLQKIRAAQLYQPMSSPLAKRTDSYHVKSKGNQKHKQMEEIRRLHRQARLELGREKVSDTEDYNKQLLELKEQADTLEIDPNLLLDEEFDEDQGGENYEEHLEDQLEDYLADAEFELEQQLKDLQIQDQEPKS